MTESEISIHAQLRLIMSAMPIIIASLPGAQYRGTLEALESLTEGVDPPILGRAIDELRQQLAAQARTVREAIETHQQQT